MSSERTTNILQLAVAALALLLIGLLITSSASASRLPTLETEQAEGYMQIALERHPALHIDDALPGSRPISCGIESKRTATRCWLEWAVGDWSYSGEGTIWESWLGGRAIWNYAYRIHRLDTYCALVEHRPKRDCTKVFVAR